jgi:hypothetical protein
MQGKENREEDRDSLRAGEDREDILEGEGGMERDRPAVLVGDSLGNDRW